ncbi:MAG UNVERIFIED_CONTAM: hypothetical protein LVR29_10935 [Microcystis novacekii LVE1205-3]
MAKRCSTALVEPPTAIITEMAFSKALRVKIWLGRICFLIASTKTSADSSVLSAFSVHLRRPWSRNRVNSCPWLQSGRHGISSKQYHHTEPHLGKRCVQFR